MNLFLEAFAWLADPAHWAGPGGIPTRLIEHVWLSALAVALAAVLAVPAGVVIGHSRKGSGPIGALTGAVRALPTLGVLTICGLWLGIGVGAPLVALVILAIPSLLAGAYSGVQNVPRETSQAAKAIGMNAWQVAWQVELPLALPVLVGGVRGALLQVVATATLAAYSADIGLGRYLFTGLKTRDYAQMLAGAVLVIVLALVLELLLAAIQHRSARKANPAHCASPAKRVDPVRAHKTLREGISP